MRKRSEIDNMYDSNYEFKNSIILAEPKESKEYEVVTTYGTSSISLCNFINVDFSPASSNLFIDGFFANVKNDNFSGLLSKLLDTLRVDEIIIENLVKNKKYLNDYINYLLGSYSEEEFREISTKYVKEFYDLNPDIILLSVERLTKIVREDLDIDDISNILNVPLDRLYIPVANNR